MKIHWLQHVPFEGLGCIEPWLTARRHAVTCTRFWAGDRLPDAGSADGLIVMGGPMGVYDEAVYPWLAEEKAFIKQIIAQNKPVLGICLGAQLIADALGAAVSKNQHREIGWFPLTSIHPAMAGIIPELAPVMHWHGDTFALPSGAERLAASAACLNQGFIYRDRVIGLQFHLETTPESLRRLIDQSREELVEGPFIQTPAAMLADPSRFTAINQMMAALLDHLQRL